MHNKPFFKIYNFIEPIGIIPRSIIRTLNRFSKQIFRESDNLIIEEFRISRYQILVSIQCLLIIIFIPLIITHILKILLLIPLTEYLWNTQQHEIFLNSYLEKEALTELQNFEEILYFEYFLKPTYDQSSIWIGSGLNVNSVEFPIALKVQIQNKTLELAEYYNRKSITTLVNLFVDIVRISSIGAIAFLFKSQLIILKSFVIEFIYNLSDTLKSALLILMTNLLLGFHSPPGWELLLKIFLDRFGFPANENFIFIFVATFPVLLNTIFKYWVFRYLNKISPSTVATYHSMME